MKNKFNVRFTNIFTSILSKGLMALAVIASIFVVGCQKDVTLPNKTSVGKSAKYKISSPDDINNVRLAFAKTLSRAIEDPDLRKYVHAQMQKRFTSDYELIYIVEKNKVIYGGKTLAQILASYAEEEVFTTYGKDFFNKVTDTDPLLAITMPELEKWDPSKWDVNFIPNVAAVLEQSPNNTKQYTIFNRRNTGGADFRNEEPDDPTLGVWDAEGAYLVDEDGFTPGGSDINGSMPSPPFTVDCDDIYLQAISALNAYDVGGGEYYLMQHNTLIGLYNDCINGSGPSGGGTGTSCTQPCARDCETIDEELVDFKINGWGVFTNIRNQIFETKYVFHGDLVGVTRNTFGTQAQLPGKFVSTTQSKGSLLNCSGVCQGKFISTGSPLFRIWRDWNLGELAEPYHISWAEVDPGETTVSLSFPLTAKFKVGPIEIGAGITPSISRKGNAIVPLGSQPVFYCDEIRRENNTGSLTFRVN